MKTQNKAKQNKTNKQVINNNDQFICISQANDKWPCWQLFLCIIEMFLCDVGYDRVLVTHSIRLYKFYANESQKETQNWWGTHLQQHGILFVLLNLPMQTHFSFSFEISFSKIKIHIFLSWIISVARWAPESLSQQTYMSVPFYFTENDGLYHCTLMKYRLTLCSIHKFL